VLELEDTKKETLPMEIKRKILIYPKNYQKKMVEHIMP
jgi:hypothetical protein